MKLLIISCLVFPISLELALVGFTYFLITSILSIKANYFSIWLKSCLGIMMAIAMIYLYIESRSHLYPVSIYDYLLLIVTVGIIKFCPLKLDSIYQICWVINSSLLVVFFRHLPLFDFTVRNHWGFENPNWLGLYCSMCFPLSITILINQIPKNDCELQISKKIGKISAFIPISALIVNLIMLISSGSRSSFYTSLFVGILVCLKFVLKFFKAGYNKQKFVTFSMISLIFFSLISKLLLLKFVFLNRFIDLGNSTNIYRVKLYKCHLELGLQKPWWGWGANKVSSLCEEKFKAGAGGVNHAHNFILQLFADHGLIITLFCLVMIIYWIILPTMKLLINYSFDSEEATIFLGISLSSLSVLLVSLFQSGFYHYPLFPLWLGLLWGCQLNFANLSKNKRDMFPLKDQEWRSLQNQSR